MMDGSANPALASLHAESHARSAAPRRRSARHKVARRGRGVVGVGGKFGGVEACSDIRAV
eukprot:CAMPEP_0206329198 /NCGR_PEP_ID=MMETSP0106_2-20121207/23075_1 /ASSEMBLY_ACC=CAM_ASM_000206 /TAXON_ID=81532 /ORGANISM="Acanthoeca-like sp., Strain 10tr" /LENGTH=59 /DNA_ID=CAMNT_0053761909 /DNA_START=78 /DNA_END=254 /DNA_ORIENTATION=-